MASPAPPILHFPSSVPTYIPGTKRSLPSRTSRQIQTNPATQFSLPSQIESCTAARLGHKLHAQALKIAFSGCREFLETRLLLTYGRCSSLNAALQLFDTMPNRSIYTWAAILTICIDHGYPDQSLLLFQNLQEEGIAFKFFTFPVILNACSILRALDAGMELHGMVVKTGFASNSYVGNALIDMYGKCGAHKDAVKALKGIPVRDCVSWNSMISGCAASGMVFEALKHLESMWELDNIRPDIVSWSAAIGGFAQNGYNQEALELLSRMVEAGIGPNAQTLASVLPACGRLHSFDTGKEIHGYVTRQEFMSNSFVVNGLIDVYRRSGDMDSARVLFTM